MTSEEVDQLAAAMTGFFEGGEPILLESGSLGEMVRYFAFLLGEEDGQQAVVDHMIRNAPGDRAALVSAARENSEVASFEDRQWPVITAKAASRWISLKPRNYPRRRR
jgi:hypothetical protein